MQCTSYVKMAPGVTVDMLHAHLTKTYENEFFVKVGQYSLLDVAISVSVSVFILTVNSMQRELCSLIYNAGPITLRDQQTRAA